MKLLCAEYNEAGRVAYSVVGDNALLRNNDDLYLPAIPGPVTCVPQFVLRVSRMGKCVGARFAGRYYEEVALGLRFRADDLAAACLADGLSPDMASAFDGSAAISPLRPRSGSVENWVYTLSVNGSDVLSRRVGDLPFSPEQHLVGASAYCMLKVGDYIYCGDPSRFPVHPGDRLQMSLNGDPLLDFEVK